LKNIDKNTLDLIFKNVSEGIFIIDENAMFIKCNEAFKQIVLYNKKEIEEKRFDEIFNLKVNFQDFIDKIKNQEQFVDNIEYTNKNNNKKHIDIKIIYVEDSNRYIGFVNNTLEHITNINNELSKNYKLLSESEDKYQNLFENIPLGIFTVKKDGSIQSINPIMLKILGSPSIDESLTLNIFENPNLKGTRILNDIIAALNFGKSFQKEYKYTSIWGKKLLIKATITPIIKNKERVIVIIEDLTKDKLLQKKLNDKTEQLFTIINNTPDIIIFKDNENKWLLANKTAINLFNIKNIDYYGKTDFDLMQYASKLKNEYENNINKDKLAWEKGSMISYDEFFYSKYEKEMVFETIKLPIYNDDGSKKALLTFGRNITNRRINELKLQTAKEKAEEADKLKSSFLANMSHEIRTPLNGIIGFSTILKEYSLKKEDVKRFTDIIIDNSKQLMSNINDILLISKLEVNQEIIQQSKFSLNDLIEKLKLKFISKLKLLPEKNIEIKIKINENDDIKITTDKKKFEIVFSKLINNAIKFTNTGKIEFGYNIIDKQNFNFFVKDTGVGIAKDKQHLIFKKFRQINDSKERLYGGTGIGLSIVNSIIDLLKGKIWLKSDTNKGANFYFTIPIVFQDENQRKKISEIGKKNDINFGNYKILVVDDVEESSMLLEEILSVRNAQIFVANNGKKAINIFNNNKDIDLILMDIQMPEMSGHDAAKKIKEINANVKIIVQTAFVDQEYNEKETKYYDDFINKPIVEKILLEKIYSVLNL